MKWNIRKNFRKLHRWGSLLIALPFLIVLFSGLFLQVKKEFDWIQPPTQTGSAVGASLPFDEILAIAQSISELEVNNWTHIDRLDVRPDKGIVKIRGINGWEAQVDAHTGALLSLDLRRSDIIEAIHDGSWFHNSAKHWIFLPSALVVFLLWITGIYLFFLPYFAKRSNRKRLAKRINERRKSHSAEHT